MPRVPDDVQEVVDGLTPEQLDEVARYAERRAEEQRRQKVSRRKTKPI
jgi:hypothetical protein